MDPDVRVRAERQRLAGAHRRREWLADVTGQGQHLFRQRSQRLLREVGGRRVDGREVGRLDRLADVEGRHLEAEAVPPAANPEAGARGQLRLEPRLVEPRRTDLARRVADVRREDVESPAPTAGRPSDDDVEHGFLVAEQRGDRPLLRGRLVASWPVCEEVTDGRDPEPPELPSHGGADA